MRLCIVQSDEKQYHFSSCQLWCQVINGDGVVDPLVRSKLDRCMRLIAQVTMGLWRSCLMSMQSTSSAPVETPMEVDGTVSLANLTSVSPYILELQCCLSCPISHFNAASIDKQVPAYDRSAFMAKVTSMAAKVSHLVRLVPHPLRTLQHQTN